MWNIKQKWTKVKAALVHVEILSYLPIFMTINECSHERSPVDTLLFPVDSLILPFFLLWELAFSS